MSNKQKYEKLRREKIAAQILSGIWANPWITSSVTSEMKNKKISQENVFDIYIETAIKQTDCLIKKLDEVKQHNSETVCGAFNPSIIEN